MSSSNSNRDLVADAGPIIALARLELLGLPGRMYDRVMVTDIVAEECLTNPHYPEHEPIRMALNIGQLQCIDWSQPPALAMWNLDRGEASTVALAADLKATVLVDDRAARHVARALRIKIIGTCGLILAARQRGLIDAVRPMLETLAESGYYLSRELIESVCELAGEP